MRSLRYRPIRETSEIKKEETEAPVVEEQPAQQPDASTTNFDESVTIN